jgi:hypothetical protein
MSLFSSVVFTYFYVYSTTFSDILLELYHLSPVTVGSCFCIFCKHPVLTDSISHNLKLTCYQLSAQPSASSSATASSTASTSGCAS